MSQIRKTLLERAKQAGLEVDGRWSDETLAEKVEEAFEEKSDKEKQAIRDNSDTWVLLKRDAFPVEDEKHMAGETICVPKDMARVWYQAGVAIPGEKPE